MSAVVTTPHERATRLAQMVLTELVADKPVYPVGLDELGRKLKDTCDELGVGMVMVLQSISLQMCEIDAGYEQRLRRRAAVAG
jgi:hypothetical protein